jgi:hypothetical protein
MTRREIRRQVVERERRIKELRKAGRTGPEIAAELGITTQRLYDFESECRRRQPVMSPADRLRKAEADRRSLAKKKIHVSGNQARTAEEILEELEGLLLTSAFTTATIRGEVTQVQITITTPFKRPRPGRGIPLAMRKLRSAIVAARQVTLLRHRERAGERVKWQVWHFTALKT